MKKLSTLLAILFLGMGISHATKTDDDRRYRGYDNSFIFIENGIEFAVFPDGQFDFNYLDYGPNVNVGYSNAAINVSFNTGFNYDRYVQYDSYGAVIQIENIPIYYDGYGRIIQAGDVLINYRRGYVNRVGNLNVFYNRPGIIHRTTGFINPFNRFYAYQPWHAYYAVPVVNRCIVWNNPYRIYYNPIRYSWNYHNRFWNNPNYYNGCYAFNNSRRSFYRPNDRVTYRSFERARRNSRGKAVAVNNNVRRSRESINRGRRSINRARDTRIASRTTLSNSRANRNAVTGRNTTDRVTRNANTTRRSSATTRANRSIDSRQNTATNRSNRTTSERAANRRSNRTVAATGSSRTNKIDTRRTTRPNRSVTRTTRSNKAKAPARTSRNNRKVTAPTRRNSSNTN